MKIVYVGEMLPGATAAMRRDAIIELGHGVVSIDTAPHRGYTIARRTIARRAWARYVDVPYLRRRIRSLLFEALARERHDMVYVDKGIFIEEEWLRELRARHPGIVLAHFNPDDPFAPSAARTWHCFLKAIPQYDVHFVPRRQNVLEYENVGARRVVFQLPSRGFDPRIHHPLSASEGDVRRFKSDVCFVGGLEEERKRSIQRLLGAGIPITVWGEGWAKALSSWPHAIVRSPVYHHDYGKAVAGSELCIGFLRKANRDGHTSRSIEIPACGSLLLAERTPDHCELFEEGREAEFFDSDEELIDKARYYLGHEQVRRRVASAGRERCLRAGYDYMSLMKERIRISMESKARS